MNTLKRQGRKAFLWDFYEELRTKLKVQGYELDEKYNGKIKFDITRKQVRDQKILYAYEKFYEYK